MFFNYVTLRKLKTLPSGQTSFDVKNKTMAWMLTDVNVEILKGADKVPIEQCPFQSKV